MKRLIFTSISVFILVVSAFAQSEIPSCPSIDVSGGGVVSRDEPMTFSVSVSDEAKYPNLEYLWTVSNGEIIEGQGTKSIKVDVVGLYDKNITATVEVNGLPENCVNTASETGSTICPPPARLFDEFGKLRDNKIGEKIEAMYLALVDEPASQGYIINYGTDKEIALREKQIRNAISFRSYNAIRITFARGGANPNGAGVWTKVWIVPPGADNPQP